MNISVIINGKSVFITKVKLLSSNNGIFEYEFDLSETPINLLLSQLSKIDGVKDIEIKKTPIDVVIAELFTAWKIN